MLPHDVKGLDKICFQDVNQHWRLPIPFNRQRIKYHYARHDTSHLMD